MNVKEHKEALRRKRVRKVRRNRMIALLTLVLLSFGVVLIINKVVKMKETNTNTEKSLEVANEPKNEKKEIPEEVQELKEELVEEIKIKVSTAGDCTLGTDVNFDQSTSFTAKYKEVGYPGYFFENVKSILEEDDLSIVNLEGTFTTSKNRQEKTYAFKGDPSYVHILTEGSIEAVNVANNHSKDYGLEGFEDTKRYVEEGGLTSFGYDDSKVMEIKGVKVGLVGIYELPDGLGRLQQLKDNIAKVKSQGAVLTIVSFHWGTEKDNYPDKIQKELAHVAIDQGADLVVGHHPHVLQGIETYKGKNIVYSLGNFSFGGNKNPSDKDTMIFQQTFTIIENQVQLDNDKNIIPCSISSVVNKNDYRPTPQYGEEAKRILEKIEKFSNGL